MHFKECPRECAANVISLNRKQLLSLPFTITFMYVSPDTPNNHFKGIVTNSFAERAGKQTRQGGFARVIGSSDLAGWCTSTIAFFYNSDFASVLYENYITFIK